MAKFKGSGVTPQTPSFQKVAATLGQPAKMLSHQMMPQQPAIKAAVKSGQFSKLSPADASGKGQIGYNLNSMSKSGMKG